MGGCTKEEEEEEVQVDYYRITGYDSWGFLGFSYQASQGVRESGYLWPWHTYIKVSEAVGRRLGFLQVMTLGTSVHDPVQSTCLINGICRNMAPGGLLLCE